MQRRFKERGPQQDSTHVAWSWMFLLSMLYGSSQVCSLKTMFVTFGICKAQIMFDRVQKLASLFATSETIQTDDDRKITYGREDFFKSLITCSEPWF